MCLYVVMVLFLFIFFGGHQSFDAPFVTYGEICPGLSICASLSACIRFLRLTCSVTPVKVNSHRAKEKAKAKKIIEQA